jgi:hypothetical protein
MHKLKLNQAVVPAQAGRERHEVYEVVRLLPALPNGEMQYRIKGRESGVERMVRESEIKPLFG